MQKKNQKKHVNQTTAISIVSELQKIVARYYDKRKNNKPLEFFYKMKNNSQIIAIKIATKNATKTSSNNIFYQINTILQLNCFLLL